MPQKSPSLKQFHDRLFDGLLATLSKIPEGKALVDFARQQKIRFEMTSMSGGEWVAGQNKVRLGAGLGLDQALGALAHELRHAWQSYEVPGLKQAEAKSGGHTAEKITMLRGMEADAFSYQLAMLITLHRQGIVKSVADGMMDKGNPIGLHTLKEVRGFVTGFAQKHSADPFSSAARKEAFEFFQSSQYFKEWYDDLYMEHFGAAASRKSSKPASLPGLSGVFATFSQNTVTTGGGHYLSPAETREIKAYTLYKLDKPLKERLNQGPSR